MLTHNLRIGDRLRVIDDGNDDLRIGNYHIITGFRQIGNVYNCAFRMSDSIYEYSPEWVNGFQTNKEPWFQRVNFKQYIQCLEKEI